MQQGIYSLVFLSSLVSIVLAEPPAFGSSSDEFDINSISSFLDDDQMSTGLNSKGISYSYSNSYGQNLNPEKYKSNSGFTFGQKTPVNSVPSAPIYSPSAAAYNQPFSGVAQPSVADYSGANSFNSNYEAYSGSPVGLGSYSNVAYSPYGNSPLVAQATNTVAYATSPVKSVSSPHSNSLSGYPGVGNFNSASSAAYPTSIIGGASTHVAGAYDGQEGSSFVGHGAPSPSNRPPYPFEKPGSVGPPHFVSNYKGSVGPYGSFEGGFSSKPPRHLGVYKSFNSGPPSHLSSLGPSGPSSYISGQHSYKTPYYSEFKTSPGVYYSSRPSHSPYSGFKSPNSYESYPGPPVKYISENSRYPTVPSKFSSSRPYSGSKISYNSRPYIYSPGNKSYNQKSPSPYSGLF